MADFWQGDLIRLRAVEPEDWETLFRWALDSEFARWGDAVGFPRSREAHRRHAAELATAQPDNDECRWIVETLDGEFAGTLNTFACDRRSGTWQYGIAITRPHWRRGYASEAIRLVLRFYFQELGYQTATVHIYDFNHASLRLHERLGFQVEGRLRRMGFTEGRHFDWIVMGLTREEFDAHEWSPGVGAEP